LNRTASEAVESMRELTEEQRNAIAALEGRALGLRAEARARIDASLRAASVDEGDYHAAVERIREQGRVALAFHPERLSRSGRTVAEGLLADGAYRTQFETGLSSGSNTAFAGGERDEWERRLFDGAYHRPDAVLSDRPRYGALFLVAHPDGPAPRFGSCYFVLRPEVSRRCTFTLLGSQDERSRESIGTMEVVEPTTAALLRHVEEEAAPLGVPGLTVRDLIEAMRAGLPCAPPGVSKDRPGRALDTFVEAQVHGSVHLERDVEALVVDASFRGSAVAETLGEIASTYDLSLAWHPGFALATESVPETFRDYPTRKLAERISAVVIDAAAIGAAHNDFARDPDAWRSFGSPSEVRTCFRRLWHALVLLGAPSGR
jgi:hypothetical protein